MPNRRNGTTKRTIGLIGACILAAALLAGGSTTTGAAPAQALDLPTWDDVQAAKQNEAAAADQVTQIKGLIAAGAKELDRLRNAQAAAYQEFQQAEQAFQAATDKARTLKEQADKSREEADRAAEQAGVIVAQMYRSGGIDRSTELFLESEGGTADALLDRLASMSKATERNTAISEEAEQAKNTAESLGKQAKAAQDERERLSKEKQAAEQAAAQAVEGQREKVVAQEQQQADLELKLTALQDKTTKTVEGYQERQRIEEEQRRAEEERRRKEAEELARQGGGGGPAAPPAPGAPAPPAPPGPGYQGWVLPVDSWVSEGFRSPGRPDHTGLDLAASCGTPIVAASSGTVSIAGWVDNFGGNMVYLNQDNGYQTRYAHMQTWPPVSNGQYVQAGQLIGWVGMTGNVTGCHLHLEVSPGYSTEYWVNYLDPAQFIPLP
ncbi:peptidoglycan DD-metalloendopeptidase family protein [Leucobacter sp. wl10]|uniref:peptidoglycan DD-metalloendopeptidase family protein n=1 Tax=Leucobacter sp. wl10 TaxID=2304677 RepID=UPI000E5C10F7|nr:peptidoglycan DD-metalloendopeptidase family protein [Leucobacter sp. wl10]RGE20321.1 M23 family peptidase [Leucobacter sp. wl10]